MFLSALVVLAVAGAIVYAGSPGTIARGIQVEGIDIGGLSAAEAKVALERRSRGVLAKPVSFIAGGRTFELKASDIRLRPDWGASIASARHAGNGFGPLRGFRRLKVRLFPINLSAKATYDQAALNATLARIAKRIDRRHLEAAVVLHGLRPAIVPDRAGSVLDRDASARTIVTALASLSRGRSVSLPLKVDQPRVSRSMLAPILAEAQVAVSRPVVLTLGPTRYKLPRWRVALLLKLPSGGATTLRIGGPGADAYFKRLQKVVNTPPHDAEFLVISGGITIKPASDGRVVDVPKTADAILAAALRRVNRVTPIAVATQPPSRTTAEAQAMGINGIVGSYTTSYGGVPNRIHNVQVVSHLVDETLIAPGKEFSFNDTTGDRNAAKGLLEAPVIINGELQTGLGGGTCQVSTTVFNAAYEAGLPITARTNHALYISHYPQGRDATVNYPDIDLRFVNDTDHWLLLRTFINASTLTVNLYGTPQHRRVESEVKPLETTGPVPTVITNDPKLLKGKQVVDETGSAPSSTSVTRRVYDENGKLLYENTWYSSYVGEKEKIRVGTKKPPPPKPKPVEPKPVEPRFGLPPELVPVDTSATAVPTTPTG